jgi:hypothetical protein
VVTFLQKSGCRIGLHQYRYQPSCVRKYLRCGAPAIQMYRMVCVRCGKERG